MYIDLKAREVCGLGRVEVVRIREMKNVDSAISMVSSFLCKSNERRA